MNKLPIARNTDVVIQRLGKEILIYDLKNHKAFNLNETSSIIYQACDGKTSFSELKVKHGFTDDLIFLALDELKKENLIEADETLISPFVGMSRREAIRKVGMGSLIALPIIASLIAPTAAQAQSVVCSNTDKISCICSISRADADSGVNSCVSGACPSGCLCRGSVSISGDDFAVVGGDCDTAPA